MLTMDQINNIRFLKRTQGKTYKEVGEITGVSYKTIKKYEELEDLTPKIRPSIKRPTKLDPFKKEIRKWLVSDKGRPHKQRHTAKRIHNRLLEKYQDTYSASYRTLAKYVTSLKKELNLGKEEFLELKHFTDEAQVDFGKATFIEKGKKCKEVT